MAITFPQFKVTNTAAGAASLASSFTNPIAAGSFIAVVALADTGITSFSFSDGHGDTATDSGLNVVNDATIGAKTQIVAFLSATSGAQTVTVTPNVSFTACEICMWEIAGITNPVFDKAISGTGTGTAATSGSTGTLSAPAEAAIGYGISNSQYNAAGSGWTGDSVGTPNGFNDLAEHQILASNAAIAATGTQALANAFRMFCVTFMAGAGTTTIGWSRALDGDRPRLLSLQADGRQAFVPLFVTAKTPAGIILPTGADRERRPPIKENPDPGKQWFVRSPNPVPALWLPVTGEREQRPTVMPRREEPWPYFSRPTTATVPISGIAWNISKEEMRPPPRPDQYVVTWNPPQAPLTTFYAGSNADDYNPLIAPRPGDYALGWAPKVPAGQVSTIAGMAWHISKEEMRPPRPPLNPDEFKPWFVRSPNPVPIIWLPLTGKDLERLPSLDRISDRYVVTWPSNIPPPTVPISGMAWHISKEEQRPPKPPLNPDEFKPWFSRSLIPVPFTWLPTAGETEHWKALQYEDRPPAFAAKPPLPPVGISGMAWFVPVEQIPRQYPGNTNQAWSPAWAPQIIIQIPPPLVTAVYNTQFFSMMGSLMSICGDPPS